MNTPIQHEDAEYVPIGSNACPVCAVAKSFMEEIAALRAELAAAKKQHLTDAKALEIERGMHGITKNERQKMEDTADRMRATADKALADLAAMTKEAEKHRQNHSDAVRAHADQVWDEFVCAYCKGTTRLKGVIESTGTPVEMVCPCCASKPSADQRTSPHRPGPGG